MSKLGVVPVVPRMVKQVCVSDHADAPAGAIQTRAKVVNVSQNVMERELMSHGRLLVLHQLSAATRIDSVSFITCLAIVTMVNNTAPKLSPFQ